MNSATCTSCSKAAYPSTPLAAERPDVSVLITDASIEFIKQNQKHPFFLLVSHETPHFPFQGPGDQDKTIDATNWTTPDAPTYVAMLEDLDTEVGRVLKTLEEQNLANDTLVVFVSDNGGFAKAAHMGPFKGAKSTTLEGGIRVPLILRWPGKIQAGTTSTQVCATFDLTRSFVKLAGTSVFPGRLDGYDIVDHLTQQKPDFKRTLYWRGKRGERTWTAIRDGDLKYVRKVEGDTEDWLYDLSADPGETEDLAQNRPGDLARLRKLLAKWEGRMKPLR